jgi:hypothetical protein
MTAQSALAAALERQPPPTGGFSPAIVRLEVRPQRHKPPAQKNPRVDAVCYATGGP